MTIIKPRSDETYQGRQATLTGGLANFLRTGREVGKASMTNHRTSVYSDTPQYTEPFSRDCTFIVHSNET